MSKPQRILIADDDDALVEALRLRCEGIGLDVVTAFDSLDALNLIHETDPDLICLDVNMPCGSGLSVLEMLANDEFLRSKPVIIMTGDATEEAVRRCHQLCAYYVEKCPSVWSRLQPLITGLLNLEQQMS